MLDSYREFLNGLGIDQNVFLDWGINNTIYPPQHIVAKAWDELKCRIDSGRAVSIRGYGRNGKGNDIIIAFYSRLGISVKIDPTNNSKPTMNLQSMTGLKKNIDVANYQVSHIFGKTKNVYMFEAPWNICYVPKIFDPLTGHEATGLLPVEYKERWLSAVRQKYSGFIEEYDHIIAERGFLNKLDTFLSLPSVISSYDCKQREKFRSDMSNEFSPIN